MRATILVALTAGIAALRLQNATHSLLSKSPGRLDAVREAQAARLNAIFAQYPNWDQTAAREAYKNLYRPGDKLPGAHAVRIVVDAQQRIYFQPEPYDLWANPKTALVGHTFLAVPEAKAPGAAVGAPVSHPWNRNMLEYGKEFTAHFMVFLTKAIRRLQSEGEAPLPPVDATVALWDWCGYFFWDHGSPAAARPPLLAWNTRQGCNTVATPTYDWELRSQNFSEGSTWRPDTHVQVPWDQRRPLLLWRGSIASWDGSRARAVAVGAKHPDLLDIKIASGGISYKAATTPNKAYATPAFPGGLTPVCTWFYAAIAAAGFITEPDECMKGNYAAPFMSVEDQLSYKYVLDVDGGASSFRLKRDMLGGATVFRVVHEDHRDANEQYFFADLRAWEHYVPVSFVNMESDLPAKVSWARANDVQARQIAANAAAFVRQHLREDDALWHLSTTLRTVATKQRGWTPGVIGEPHLRRFCCADLKIAAETPFAAGVSSTWTNLDGKIFPALHEQCQELHEAECIALRGPAALRSATPASTAPAAAQDGSSLGFARRVVGTQGVAGSTEAAVSEEILAGGAGRNAPNFFATALEWKPL